MEIAHRGELKVQMLQFGKAVRIHVLEQDAGLCGDVIAEHTVGRYSFWVGSSSCPELCVTGRPGDISLFVRGTVHEQDFIVTGCYFTNDEQAATAITTLAGMLKEVNRLGEKSEG